MEKPLAFHAHVETEDGYYDVTTYGAANFKIETRPFITGASVRRFLNQLYEKNPKRFTSNWNF